MIFCQVLEQRKNRKAILNIALKLIQKLWKKTKLEITIYAAFERILVPEDNGKQNPNESYTNKYQKHIACNYSYKLVCVDDKFSKFFK